MHFTKFHQVAAYGVTRFGVIFRLEPLECDLMIAGSKVPQEQLERLAPPFRPRINESKGELADGSMRDLR